MIAYHSIFGMYGFWLPNDPRGSGSDYIANWELFRYGGATKLGDRQHSVASMPHDTRLRLEAKKAMRFPPVVLDNKQESIVADGFTVACREGGYRIHACAVLCDHVHLVIGSHPRNIRMLVGHLKSRATRQLKQLDAWSGDDRPVWGEHGWNVYLDGVEQVAKAIAYTEENPRKEGRPKQDWPFVTPFDGIAVASRAVSHAKRTRIGGAALRSMEARRNREA